MHVVVEAWKARPTWRNTTPAERAAYLDMVFSAVHELLTDGVELVASGSTGDTDAAKEFDYWAVWRFADHDRLAAFARKMQGIGWNDRFEAVNVGVEARAIPRKNGTS